jgi:hypothetical protein
MSEHWPETPESAALMLMKLIDDAENKDRALGWRRLCLHRAQLVQPVERRQSRALGEEGLLFLPNEIVTTRITFLAYAHGPGAIHHPVDVHVQAGLARNQSQIQMALRVNAAC